LAILRLTREHVRAVLAECIRSGEELVTQSDLVERTGGYRDWLHLFERCKERTLVELRAVYDGDEIPLEFEAATVTAEHSTPRFTVAYRRATLGSGIWKLQTLRERLPLAVEPSETSPAGPSVRSPDSPVPYGSRPTADLVKAAEDHFLEHKQTLLYDLVTRQANPGLENLVIDRICGFSNAEGGTVLIGVEDRTGRVTGLGYDLKLVRDVDALINRLSQKVHTLIQSLAPLVRITPEPIGTETVLRLDVPRGERPVFVRDRFMVRINNSTQELKGQAELDYIRSRFDRA
jgi:hypothetical protein